MKAVLTLSLILGLAMPLVAQQNEMENDNATSKHENMTLVDESGKKTLDLKAKKTKKPGIRKTGKPDSPKP